METSEILNQVKDLLTTKNQGDLGRLRELLDFLQEIKTKCREEIQENEDVNAVKLEEIELKKRELDHNERMRALELGQPISDPGEIGKAHSAIWAAAVIGLILPLAMVGAGITTTALVLRTPADGMVRFFDVTLDRHVALIAVTWKVCGLVSLVVGWLSLRTIRKARETTPLHKLAPRRAVEEQPLGANR